MKTENISFTHKKKQYSATIVWPDNLAEAIHLLGEREVFHAFRSGYLEHCKRKIVNPTPRPRIRKIDLSKLTADQADYLESVLAALTAVPPVTPTSQNVLPEQPQTDQTDFSETQEAAPAQASPSGDSFEADFARYSASLDSLPQPHMETGMPRAGSVEDPRQSIQMA